MKGRLWLLGLVPGPMQYNMGTGSIFKTFAIPHDSEIVQLSALLAVAILGWFHFTASAVLACVVSTEALVRWKSCCKGSRMRPK